MSKLFYSPEAFHDLAEIKGYIAEELENPAAADRAVERILDSAERLKQFPGLGAKLSAIIDVENEYRYLVCGKYMVFYRENKKFIYVDRILYGGRDYIKVLFGEFSEEEV